MNPETTDPDLTGLTRRQRLSLLGIIALFLVPLAGAWLLYHFLPSWQPKRTVNHGELVRPARPLPDVSLSAPDGSEVFENLLNGRWTLLTMTERDCSDACENRQHQLRQAHARLHKDIARVHRVLVVLDPSTRIDHSRLTARFPDLRTVTATATAVADWLAEFRLSDGVAPERSGRVYLIDPLGNLMMFYGADVPASGILEDLERLLRISRIG